MPKKNKRAEVDRLIEKRDWNGLRVLTAKWVQHDLAVLLLDMERSQRVLFFRSLSRQISSKVFTLLDPDDQDILLRELTDQESYDLLESMNPDDRTALLEELPAQVTKKMLNHLSTEELKEARRLLGYPEESVGRLMTPDYVAVSPEWTVRRAIEEIRGKGNDSETINMVYIVDKKGKLLDDIRLRLIILSAPDTKIEDIMDRDYVGLSAFDDRESAVREMQRYDLVALPVVDSDGVLLGIVTFDDVFDVAEEETTEDIQKSASLLPLGMSYNNAGILKLYAKRIGWLLILVVMSLASTGIIAAFESTLNTAIALAMFIPLLIGSGGNTGSQSATLMIRALVTEDVKLSQWARVLFKEIVVGIMLGVSLGLIGWGLGLFRGGMEIGMVVGLSMVAIVIIANLIGMSLPFLLAKLNLDPAVASNPLMTTIADVIGLLIYFWLAKLIIFN